MTFAKSIAASLITGLAIAIGTAPVFGQAPALVPYLERIETAELFQWSPSAEHHAAVVRVTAGSAGGSGCYVQYGELLGVLTAAHVTDGSTQATVHWSDGTSTTGGVTRDKFYVDSAAEFDAAFIFVTHDKITPRKFADREPAVGERIEHCGYGGPGKRLRHFYGTFQGVEGNGQRSSAPTINGDSGGPWFNASGEVFGIQSTGGGGTLANVDGWPVYANCRSCYATPIRNFLGRIFAQRCGPGGCSPYPPQQPGGGGGGLYPPQQPIQPPIAPRPQEIDYGQLAERIDYQRLADLLAQDQRLRGKDGAVGAPGPAGPAGPQGAAGSVSQSQVTQITQDILSVMRTDPAFRGPDPQGINVEMYDSKGSLVDREHVPDGGTLRLRSYIQQATRSN